MKKNRFRISEFSTHLDQNPKWPSLSISIEKLQYFIRKTLRNLWSKFKFVKFSQIVNSLLKERIRIEKDPNWLKKRTFWQAPIKKYRESFKAPSKNSFYTVFQDYMKYRMREKIQPITVLWVVQNWLILSLCLNRIYDKWVLIGWQTFRALALSHLRDSLWGWHDGDDDDRLHTPSTLVRCLVSRASE